jgi:hypothetical protein
MGLYIKKIIDAFPEKVTGVTSTLAADHLFGVRPSSEARLLPKEQARAIHHTTVNTSFYHVFLVISRPLFFPSQQE